MFSVIVPLYNKRPYIRRCVDSVLNQTFNDFELIVVDDGSTDDSHEALADIRDSRFRLVRKKNHGVGAARNSGMELASREWIAFLDADDMWLPRHLAELKRIVTLYPKAGLVSTKCLAIVDNKSPVSEDECSNAQIRRVDYFLEASRNIGVINASSTAVRRVVYCDVGGFGNSKAGEDLEFWARVALYNTVAISNCVTCVYFRNTGGVMEQLAQQQSKVLPVSNLRDLSPSVAYLCDVADRDPAQWKDPSISTYVNSRVYNAIRAAIYHGDLARAKDLKSLLLPSSDFRVKLLKYALNLPEFAIKIGLASFRKVKEERAKILR